MGTGGLCPLFAGGLADSTGDTLPHPPPPRGKNETGKINTFIFIDKRRILISKSYSGYNMKTKLRSNFEMTQQTLDIDSMLD